ncbi:MAG: type II secretion system protein M [Pseudomonadota bacterium]
MIARLTESLQASALGAWYRQKEQNEQRIILAVGCAILATILWAGIWQPLNDWRGSEVKRQNTATQLLDWVKRNQQQAQAATRSASRNGGPGRALIPIITRVAKANDIAIKGIKPESNGIISVSLQQQSFNDVVKWVAQLEENNGIVVQRANFDSGDAVGYVNARLRLN